MTETASAPNPDLIVNAENQPRFSWPDHRRHGYHNLHNIRRYSTSYRASRVMLLRNRMDLRIANMEEVRRMTSLPWFSAMVVVRGKDVLFERYAPDFGPDHPHSIQSVTKTMASLIIGRLVEDGKIDLERKVADFLPWIGSGYATATVQQVLNMDVANDYSEDYSDPQSTTYRHDEAYGLRVATDPELEYTQRTFLATISSEDTTNRTGYLDYKSANTDVLALIAESAGGRPLRTYLADIADAAGIEGCFHMGTDREGFPGLGGSASLTARDLARYGSLFVRRGRGIDGRQVGSASFIESTLQGGIAVPAPFGSPFDSLRHSNHMRTDGRWVGHGGLGGQYMLADLTSGVVGVFFSVIENMSAIDRDYFASIAKMLSDIGRLEF